VIKQAENTQLGRRYVPDDRDHRHLLRRSLPVGVEAVMPTRNTWNFNGSPLDQGNTGTCVEHAIVHYLHVAPKQTGFTRLPPQYSLYPEMCLADEWTDNDSDTQMQFGTSVRAGMKVLQAHGWIGEYQWAFNLQEVIEWVLLKGPVILGTNWYDSMFDVYNGGISIAPSSRISGGHAYLLRGVDTLRRTGRIVNSWGAGWGKDGEATISFRDLERLIHEDGEAAVAVQIKV
jgi:hypothetical protein